ncbi:hypothetical protein [Rubripirellula reticaptiva]|uniref:Uncharacterized protein n=1 Tax=Rubripirellula reticaptiva TaxID=2528013 RepID=A0A5C6EHE5_9BACT|nr:hypothetical protein [Rubripirellula reticaptiva]TWU47904.1 hypothetical protein Poly59_47480 [Rubripirellula reticaptiva]
MTVSNCPRCAEPIRLPVDPEFSGSLIDDAQGECPWCGESFPMSELVRKLPPMLVVRSADGQAITPALAGAAVGLAGIGTGTAAGIVGNASAAVGGELMDDDDLSNLTVVDEPGLNETINDDDLGVVDADETVSDFGSEADASFSPDDDLDYNQDIESDEHADDGYDDVPVVDEQPIEYQLDSANEHSISADWDADQDSQPMRVSPTRRKKKGAPWKTAVGVIAGGALALPIADGLLTLAGRESILGIWPSKSTTVSSNNVRVSPPMELSDDNDPTNSQPEPAGRSLDMPSTQSSSLQDASSAISDLMNAAEATTTESETSFPDPAAEPAVADYGNVEEPETPSEDSLAMPAMETPSFDVPVTEEPVAAEPIAEEPTAETGFTAQPSIDTPEIDVSATDAFSMPPADSVADAPAATEALSAFAPPAEPIEETADSPELTSALDEANRTLDAVLAMDDSDPLRTKAMAVAYREISKVGVLADANSDSAKDLLTRVKQSPLLSKYENASTKWFSYPNRGTEGILVIGKTESTASGQGIRVGDELVLVSQGELPSSDRVIALGKISGDAANTTVEVTVAESL